jgi:hypothetical protein
MVPLLFLSEGTHQSFCESERKLLHTEEEPEKLRVGV